jgi:protein-tyrosine phosphatase
VQSILFVCLGNICRSPLAEGIAKDLARKKGLDIKIDSAGTSGRHAGETPCQNSIKVANMHGIDISYQRARQVNREDFTRFDIIVGLDSSNIENLKRMGAQNIIKLGNYGADAKDVPDPYFFNGFEGFIEVYTMIENCVETLFKEIEYNRFKNN